MINANDDTDELLAEEDAGKELGNRPKRTMQQWRYLGKGPKYIKIGGRVYYRRSAIRTYLNSRERDPEAA